MNTITLKYLLSTLVFTAVLNAARTATPVLSKRDGGNEKCKTFDPNSYHDSNGSYGILEDAVFFTMARPTQQENPFPLTIKAFDEFGNNIGSSDLIPESLLRTHQVENDLLSADIRIQIRLYTLRPYANLHQDCIFNPGQPPYLKLEITYKIFSEGLELNENASIYDHPELQRASNLLNTSIDICCSSSYFRNEGAINQPDLKINKSKLKNQYSNNLLQRDLGVLLSPNPAKSNSNFKIRLESVNCLDLKILSSLGFERFSKSFNELTKDILIDTAGWPPGYYYIIINSTSNKEILKLVLL